MANTFTYVSVTNGQAKFKKNSEYWHIIEEEDKLDQIGANTIRMFNHNGIYDINLAVDTVIIDGTTYGPGSAFDTVYDALNPLFHKANTGTGGTGEAPTLQQVLTAGKTLAGNNFVTINGDDIFTIEKNAVDTSLSLGIGGGQVEMYYEDETGPINLIVGGGRAILYRNGTAYMAELPAELATKAYVDANAGGGLALESYQNSAMTTPVQAYVFRDADNNIVRVYEPLRNNDVSRFTFAYADSIDKFPFNGEFDSGEGVMLPTCFNNRVLDVKLIDVESDVKIQGSTLATMVINGNSHTELQIIDHNQKGFFGFGCPHLAEIYISGDNVIFSGTVAGSVRIYDAEGQNAATYFDSIGAGSHILSTNFKQTCKIEGNGNRVELWDCSFGQYCRVSITNPNLGRIIDVTTIYGALITISGTEATFVDTNNFGSYSVVNISCDNFYGNNIGEYFGLNGVHTFSTETTTRNFISTGGVDYELTVTDVEGVLYQTLTAV